MRQDYYFLSNRMSHLEKTMEMLIDRLNEVSPETRELKLKANIPRWDLPGCKSPFSYFYCRAISITAKLT